MTFYPGRESHCLVCGGPGGQWSEYAVVEQDWSPAADGPPLWGWTDLEEARSLLRSLSTAVGWHIVERDVTVSEPRPIRSSA